MRAAGDINDPCRYAAAVPCWYNHGTTSTAEAMGGLVSRSWPSTAKKMSRIPPTIGWDAVSC
jgi:hypothetical protein